MARYNIKSKHSHPVFPGLTFLVQLKFFSFDLRLGLLVGSGHGEASAGLLPTAAGTFVLTAGATELVAGCLFVVLNDSFAGVFTATASWALEPSAGTTAPEAGCLHVRLKHSPPLKINECMMAFIELTVETQIEE